MPKVCPRTLRLTRWLAFWSAVAACTIGTVIGGAPGAAQADAQSGVIYWGAAIKGWPDDMGAVDTFENRVGKRVSIVHWGQPWSTHGKEGTFQRAYFQAVRDRGSMSLLDWGSWDSCCDMKQPGFTMAGIASGAHDPFLVRWAQAARAWGHPFFLRLNWEMNGWWVPWSVQVNGNSPDSFVRAWRHIVEVFRAQKATNVTWVWCPNIATGNSTPIASVYPGDGYVDWTCLDGYNFAGTQSLPWVSFADVFNGSALNGNRNSYQAIVKLAPNKPMMIGETASAESGGSKANWITSALEDLTHTFPQIRALLWFESDQGDPKLQWPVESSSAAQAAFAAAIASSTYAANEYGQLDVSPIPPGITAAAPPAPAPAPAPAAAPTATPAPAPAAPAGDPRLFDATHFRIDDDRIWGYFGSRGGIDIFGYPVSRTFLFLGCSTQIFQRQVAQVCDDGQPRLLNLLDPDLFPYTTVNGSTLPAPDDQLKSITPSIDDPGYGSAILDFVRSTVPDSFDGMPVNFAQTYFGLVTSEMSGTSDPTLVGLINLEVWGAPISQPTADPGNSAFVYQRFQRGIMHYDATSGVTRGLLLADYLKAVMTGENVPPDLDEQAQGGRLYHQYCPDAPNGVCRPGELPATDLRGAFDPL